MIRSRFELFVKKLNLSNHPKSYNGNIILDKIAERKTESMLYTLHEYGINMDKFIEYNLLNIDSQWRYNIVMSAVQDRIFKVKDIKHIMPIDEFIDGMVQEHQSLRSQYEGRKCVFETESMNVDKYLKSIVVSAVDAMIQEKTDHGKDFKSYLNSYEIVIANESGVYSEEEVEIAKELKADRDEAIARRQAETVVEVDDSEMF